MEKWIMGQKTHHNPLGKACFDKIFSTWILNIPSRNTFYISSFYIFK